MELHILMQVHIPCRAMHTACSRWHLQGNNAELVKLHSERPGDHCTLANRVTSSRITTTDLLMPASTTCPQHAEASCSLLRYRLGLCGNSVQSEAVLQKTALFTAICSQVMLVALAILVCVQLLGTPMASA